MKTKEQRLAEVEQIKKDVLLSDLAIESAPKDYKSNSQHEAIDLGTREALQLFEGQPVNFCGSELAKVDVSKIEQITSSKGNVFLNLCDTGFGFKQGQTLKLANGRTYKMKYRVTVNLYIT